MPQRFDTTRVQAAPMGLDEKHPLFIVGAPRSGTTFLTRFVNRFRTRLRFRRLS